METQENNFPPFLQDLVTVEEDKSIIRGIIDNSWNQITQNTMSASSTI